MWTVCLHQTYQNLEIILVDDGSPDQCPQICEDYAKKEERIHVIHQENRGLSGARNAGIDVAKGEYLAFVDSDDYVSDDYIQVMYDAIKATGCAISQCRFTYTKGEKLKENRGTGAFRIYRGNSRWKSFMEMKRKLPGLWWHGTSCIEGISSRPSVIRKAESMKMRRPPICFLMRRRSWYL